MPDRLIFSLPEPFICLLTDDGSLTTANLAQSLIKQGWPVVVLSFPPSVLSKPSPLPTGIKRFVLPELTEASVEQQLDKITKTYGSIGAFIHLHPCFSLTTFNEIHYLEADKMIVKQVFFMAKHLKKSLTEAASQGYGCFITAARLDGMFGLGQKNNFSAIAAGLFGLTKTVNLEWPSVFCRAIDLSPAVSPEPSAQYILAELHDPNRRIFEVGYSERGRATLCV